MKKVKAMAPYIYTYYGEKYSRHIKKVHHEDANVYSRRVDKQKLNADRVRINQDFSRLFK